MPELDGFSAVAEIRKIASPAVIMLSARGEEYDKIHGFELGVDDYVVKPFSPKELMMRVNAVMNRVNRTGGSGARSSARRGSRWTSPRGPSRWTARGSIFAEGVRPALLPRQQPRHRADARDADHKRVGL